MAGPVIIGGTAPGLRGGSKGGPAPTGKPVVQPGSHTGSHASDVVYRNAGSNPGVPSALLSYLRGGNLPPALLYKAAKALVAEQTNGPYGELQRQININNQQTGNALGLTTQGFRMLGGQAQQAVGDENTIFGQGQTQLQGIGQATQNQLGQITQNAQQALQKYTPPSDPGLADPGQQALIAEGARQQGLAAQYSGAAQTAGNLMGQNYQGLAASDLGSGAAYGRQALANIAQAGQLKNEPLTAKQATIRGNEGPLLIDTLGKLVQQQTNNRIAERGLNIKNSEFNATLKNDQANRNLQLKLAKAVQRGEWKRAMAIIRAENNRNKATIRGENNRNKADNIARKAAARAKASGTGLTKPLTTDQQNRMFTALSTMMGFIKEASAAGHSHGNISQALQTGTYRKGFPAQPIYLINAAFQLVNSGHIWQQTAQVLRQHGLRPAENGYKIGPAQPVGGSNPAAQVPGIGRVPGA